MKIGQFARAVAFLASVSAPTVANADSYSDGELYIRKCVAAKDAADAPGMAVYCAMAAESLAEAAAHLPLSERDHGLDNEALYLSLASYANRSFDMPKAKVQMESVVRILGEAQKINWLVSRSKVITRSQQIIEEMER